MTPSYYAPTGGLPGQTELTTDRAVFTEAYAVLPRGTMRDIVTSYLPFWEHTRLWVIARPLSGFAETFSQYIVEVSSGGGSERPETDPIAEAVLFVVEGALQLTIESEAHELGPGGYAYLPPGAAWTLRNRQDDPARFHWIRKAYQHVDGLQTPAPFVTNEREMTPIPMPGTNGAWTTTRFVDPADVRHDMHVNLVNFLPGARSRFRRRTSWSMGCMCSKARPCTCSTAIGSRWRLATSCGCGRSVRRRVMPAARVVSDTCCTRT